MSDWQGTLARIVEAMENDPDAVPVVLPRFVWGRVLSALEAFNETVADSEVLANTVGAIREQIGDPT